MKRILLAAALVLLMALASACSKQQHAEVSNHEQQGSVKETAPAKAQQDDDDDDDEEHEHEDVEIGQSVQNGMDIKAVYIPHAIEVFPKDRGGQDGNIHLEADIHATKDSSFGFHEGEWIPYLTIKYEILNLDTQEKINGQLFQMVAGDPHYASNIMLPKKGNYELTYVISPPDLARHVDNVKGFYEPITLKWKFVYDGIIK